MGKINIAIDGPAGAGKSTVARMVAGRLHFKYVDTGAMYRAVTWNILQKQIALDDEAAIVHAAEVMNLELETTPTGTLVYVNGEDVTDAIRSVSVTAKVSQIASISDVRAILVRKQKLMAEAGGVVMDGRDIGTNVLPDAELKIFLTASIEERAMRRFKEMRGKGIDTEFNILMREIADRDKLDSNRTVSPLQQATDAVVIDTTGLSIDEVVKKILSLTRTKIGEVE